ncbi:MAG: bifunctional phosphoribosyl-AMP cyclohydrolase/phosphoribosyl-ATP diphosphatase HisIE [Polyangiaceae bacterium]|nr:bifunctional phosphoribosyl-AMP cyclohydrolase/phosphoribosyl-ATP diphosphatase HisIE [Polyangiaceae bacterium]
MSHVVFDERGLVVAVAQDAHTGEVRMVAWMNREALRRTLETGRATFFSRSRQALWTKGEESGNVLVVTRVGVDCDGDTLLLLVEPAGPSCHTGRPSCFFRAPRPDGGVDEAPIDLSPSLVSLERDVEARAGSTGERSYTRSLLDGGAARVGAKVREEADELARALDAESDERVLSEAADLLYHVVVGLRLRGLSFAAVARVLARRRGVSGHDEKRARTGGAAGRSDLLHRDDRHPAAPDPRDDREERGARHRGDPALREALRRPLDRARHRLDRRHAGAREADDGRRPRRAVRGALRRLRRDAVPRARARGRGDGLHADAERRRDARGRPRAARVLREARGDRGRAARRVPRARVDGRHRVRPRAPRAIEGRVALRRRHARVPRQGEDPASDDPRP